MPDRQDRARGLLLGAALGDALGAPFEGAVRVRREMVTAEEDAESQLGYTDDTALTLVLAEHLAERAGDEPLDEDRLAREFAQAWAAEPWRGYGPGAQEIFRQIDEGDDWRIAARSSFGGQGSFGNGGAMRAAPVALVARELAEAAELARRSARITHAHADGESGAALQACATYLALHSDPDESLDLADILHQLGQVLCEQHWLTKLEAVTAVSPEPDPERAARWLGNGVEAVQSVPVALVAFLTNPGSPADAIRWAVLAGGDTDTIASMAGALAGARNGARGLPPAWVSRLEHADRLTAVADRLAAVSHR